MRLNLNRVLRGWIRMLNHIRNIALAVLMMAVAGTAMAGLWQVVENEDYKFEVPSEWKVEKGREMPGPDFTLDLQGKLIPTEFNNKPTSVSGFIRAIRGGTLQEGIRNTISINRSNRDKYFATDSDMVTYFTLKSGEEAAIIKTRWTRMMQNIQQTKYDLVVYSKKKDHIIDLAIFFGYADKNFSLETKHELDKRMREVFDTFELKK
jgi:hypothetical protein